MQIVKPYGRSHAERNADGKISRVIRLTPDPAKGVASDIRADVKEFAQSNDRLVIAQWISAIDKIASKPNGDKAPTAEQREFRQRLGAAAWGLIEAKGLLPGLKDAAQKERLRKFWNFRLAPYGPTDFRPPGGKRPPGQGPLVRPLRRRRRGRRQGGRREDRRAHLRTPLLRAIPDARRPRLARTELVAARARSIANNVFKPDRPTRWGGNAPGWSEADRMAYAEAGDVAGEIRLAAEGRERGEGASGQRGQAVRRANPGRASADLAGAALYAHYGRLFRGADGKPLPISEAKERSAACSTCTMRSKGLMRASSSTTGRICGSMVPDGAGFPRCCRETCPRSSASSTRRAATRISPRWCVSAR